MRENACWTEGSTQKSYNCGFGQNSKGDIIFAGTRLYHAGAPVVLRDDLRDDLELQDLLEEGSKFIFFRLAKNASNNSTSRCMRMN